MVAFQSQISRYLPLFIMGGLTVAAGITSMFLPETLGAHLPQTIAEAEEFGKGVSFFHHPKRSGSILVYFEQRKLYSSLNLT